VGHVIEGDVTYVAGAPRKMHNFGQVLLYVEARQKLQFQFSFTGQQIASGFGYQLTIGDFNADGSVFSSALRAISVA